MLKLTVFCDGYWDGEGDSRRPVRCGKFESFEVVSWEKDGNMRGLYFKDAMSHQMPSGWRFDGDVKCPDCKMVIG